MTGTVELRCARNCHPPHDCFVYHESSPSNESTAQSINSPPVTCHFFNARLTPAHHVFAALTRCRFLPIRRVGNVKHLSAEHPCQYTYRQKKKEKKQKRNMCARVALVFGVWGSRVHVRSEAPGAKAPALHPSPESERTCLWTTQLFLITVKPRGSRGTTSWASTLLGATWVHRTTYLVAPFRGVTRAGASLALPESRS